MKLYNLSHPTGAKHPSKRRGCGVGSGHGKTSGRGHKGMKSRSGGGVRPGFEGGQMPLYRKLPMRGFNNSNFANKYAVVNVSSLEELGLAEVSRDDLLVAGLVRASSSLPLKILGGGSLTKKITVKADKFSTTAVKKIEAAGGKVILTSPTKVE